MLKSLSGPSGHVAGARFVFDETRTRFVYPQDKSLIVYFQWAAPPGLHTISAVWKGPDGRPSSIPSDIKIETTGPELTAYWTFDIGPSDNPGIWTLDTRVDGAPAGSHTFELYLPPVVKPVTASAPAALTTDEVYRAALPSLVIVSSLDATGQRLDTGMGFVYAQDRIATAFQAIDGASAISVTFADRTSVQATSLAGWNRAGDWALIPVPTGARKALNHAPSSVVKVGERLLAFTVEDETGPVTAIVEVTGRAGGSLQLRPPLRPVSAGSPVFDEKGDVIAIAGAWTTPGSRVPTILEGMNKAVWGIKGNVSGATPIESVQPQQAGAALLQLTDSGVFTQPIERFPSLSYATTTDVPSNKTELPDRNVTEFPRNIPLVWVVSLWTRREKVKSAIVSAALFDSTNHKRAETESNKVSFGIVGTRVATSFATSAFSQGIYRVDLYADGRVVWRCFVKIGE